MKVAVYKKALIPFTKDPFIGIIDCDGLDEKLADGETGKSFFDEICDSFATLVMGEFHSECEFSIVLEQAVRPCRAMSVLIESEWATRSASTVDR